MKVCVFGAGAIGGRLAGRLFKGGAEVSAIARGGHKTSILQDLELGRPMEIDPLYTVPLQMARAAGLYPA